MFSSVSFKSEIAKLEMINWQKGFSWNVPFMKPK